MSNCYPVNKCYGDKKECHHGGDYNHGHHHGHHSHVDCKPNKTIFKCKESCGTNIRTTIPTGETSIITEPTVIGVIAARDLCCFKNPCVKLDISSVVSVSTSSAYYSKMSEGEETKQTEPQGWFYNPLVSLEYIISKRCENEDAFKPIKNITALSIPFIGTPLTIPVALSVCDCQDLCSRSGCCCEYKVEIVATVTGAYSGMYVNIMPSYTSLSITAGESDR